LIFTILGCILAAFKLGSASVVADSRAGDTGVLGRLMA
jgi:hypothetical protein